MIVIYAYVQSIKLIISEFDLNNVIYLQVAIDLSQMI